MKHARLISAIGVALTAGLLAGLFFVFDAASFTELQVKLVCSAMSPLQPYGIGITDSQKSFVKYDSIAATCEGSSLGNIGSEQFNHGVVAAANDGERFEDGCGVESQVPSVYALGNYEPDLSAHPGAFWESGQGGMAFLGLITDGVAGSGWICSSAEFTQSFRDMGTTGTCEVVDDGSRTTFQVKLDPAFNGTSKPATATVSGKCDPNLGKFPSSACW